MGVVGTLRYPPALALLFGLLATVPTKAQISNSISEPPAALTPSCATPNYTPITPPPDAVANAWNSRKRYRLVIGAGEFVIDPSMNRSYVQPTAALVDASLAALGYLPLPNLSGGPYLTGKNATKAKITAAITQLATLTKGQDYGIIYYVGHGAITPSNHDLSLSVWDRPVAADEGVRVSDLLGTLENHDWHSNITNIPHYMLILDACFSGNAALGVQTTIVTTNNVQRIVEIQNQIVPEQIAILAATADGDSSKAYDLHGTNLSAFGYYFSRAITKDWACADAITPDGILTLNELSTYMKNRLKLAWTQKAIDAPMVPSILNKDANAFIAYDASKHSLDGLRDEIVEILAKPPLLQTASLTLSNGNIVDCASTKGCAIAVSKKYAVGTLLIETRSTIPPGAYASVICPSGDCSGGIPDPYAKKGQVDFKDLLSNKHQNVAGVEISIK
jgi:hypothetical protein